MGSWSALLVACGRTSMLRLFSPFSSSHLHIVECTTKTSLWFDWCPYCVSAATPEMTFEIVHCGAVAGRVPEEAPEASLLKESTPKLGKRRQIKKRRSICKPGRPCWFGHAIGIGGAESQWQGGGWRPWTNSVTALLPKLRPHLPSPSGATPVNPFALICIFTRADLLTLPDPWW